MRILAFRTLVVVSMIFSSSPASATQNVNGGEVCSHDLVTYSSRDAAKLANATILHCGPCGACSNEHDANIYRTLTKSLTQTAKTCAILMTVFGRGAGSLCLRHQVGFSDACNDCWLDDMLCAQKHCLLTCLTAPRMKQQNAGTHPCIECDEVVCGPAFKRCSGATRRRLGISSDIDRKPNEFCTIVDPPPTTQI